MTLTTRKPTGKPSWPALLLAGGEKTGKSWACAVASASDRLDSTLWVSVGETDPDEYGAIPGVNFDIVQHDGTLTGILAVLTEIASLPATNKPRLLVVDSMTRLWDMVTDQAQANANRRTKNGGEGVITMDLWNRAKGFWGHLVQAILAHDGPVLLTSRLEAVTVMDDHGKPTALKADKIKTEKNLPYDVDGVIEMPERGKVFISGVRSTRLQVAQRREFKDFTVEKLWDALGIEDVTPRHVSAPVGEDPDAEAIRQHEAEMVQQ